MGMQEPVIQRDRLMIPSGNVQLEAELCRPSADTGSNPAVIFLPGSGASPFWDYMPGFLVHFIESVFLPHGYAVLYVNKRGVGKSGGHWQQNSFQGRADDVYAAVRFLQQRPDIDSQRIGLIGHSQGGWIANLAAAQHADIAFFISLAGPTSTVKEQIRHTVEIALGCRGLQGVKLKRKIAWQMAQSAVGAALGKILPFGEMGHIARIYTYNPQEAIRAVCCPGLYVFAGLDSLVPPEPNLERFKEIWPEGPPQHLSTVVIPETDHLFHITDTVCFNFEESKRKPYTPVLVEVLQDWLRNHEL